MFYIFLILSSLANTWDDARGLAVVDSVTVNTDVQVSSVILGVL